MCHHNNNISSSDRAILRLALYPIEPCRSSLFSFFPILFKYIPFPSSHSFPKQRSWNGQNRPLSLVGGVNERARENGGEGRMLYGCVTQVAALISRCQEQGAINLQKGKRKPTATEIFLSLFLSPHISHHNPSVRYNEKRKKRWDDNHRRNGRDIKAIVSELCPITGCCVIVRAPARVFCVQ